MKILIAAPEDAHCRVNFIDGFKALGHQVGHVPHCYPDLLADTVRFSQPDLLFHVLVDTELPPDRLAALKASAPGMQTLQFACDDDWRSNVSLRHAAAYDWCTTNDPDAVPLYRSLGIEQVRHVQYGFRPDLYYPRNVPKRYDVTFVGQAYVGRPEILRAVQATGVDLWVWGPGWEHFPDITPVHGGVPDTEEMLDIQCASRISLGLNWCAGGPQAGSQPQVKARVFEGAALGAFQLNYYDRRLKRYFAPDEMATWSTPSELLEAIRYYLAHEDTRETIAAKARARCLREHTWAHRWAPLFREIEEKHAVLSR